MNLCDSTLVDVEIVCLCLRYEAGAGCVGGALLVGEPDVCSIPRLEVRLHSQSRIFFPELVNRIQIQVEEITKARCIVLKHLEGKLHAEPRRGDIHVCELELIGSVTGWGSEPAFWCYDLNSVDLRKEKDWLVRGQLERECCLSDSLSPWQTSGWYARVMENVESVLRDRVKGRIRSVRQIKGAWERSAVFEIDTNAGEFVLKGFRHDLGDEGAFIQALQEGWPDNVPRVLAVGDADSWLLMRSLRPFKSLESFDSRRSETHIEAIVEAVRLFSRIQLSSVESVDRYIRIGCRLLDHDGLINGLAEVISSRNILKFGRYQMHDDEIQEAQIFLQMFRESFSMDSFEVPQSLNHQDFRPGNIAVCDDGRIVIFDWQDSIITHPFYGMCYFLNRANVASDVDAEDHLVQEYLKVWETAGFRRARTDFQRIRNVFPLYECFRCFSELKSLRPESAWARGTMSHVPRALREGISRWTKSRAIY